METYPRLADSFGGINGFEEFRKYIKQGNDMCRTLSTIVQERFELEQLYVKGLAKISAKLTKTESVHIGTVSGAWNAVAKCMEDEAELHRSFAVSLQDDIHKPISNLAKSFHESRKPIEANIDKAVKVLIDKRDEEARAKKKSFTLAKEAEKAWDQLAELKVNHTSAASSSADKEERRSEKKCKSVSDSARKADKEYYDSCIRAEFARLDWESVVFKGLDQLQRLEVDRLKQLHEILKKYHVQLSALGPGYTLTCSKLQESVITVNTSEDVKQVAEQRGTGPNQPEQYLYELCAEDFNLPMEKTRRENLIRSYLAIIWQDVEKQNKAKEGIEKLILAYKNRPEFADETTQEDSRHKLNNVLSMLNFLYATHYKLQCALATLNGRPKPEHAYAAYLEKTKDRQSLPQTLLRIPTPNSAQGGSVTSLPLPPLPTDSTTVDYTRTDSTPIAAYSSEEFDSDEYYEIPSKNGAQNSQPPSQARLVSQTSVTSRKSVPSQATVPKRAAPSPSRQSLHCVGWCKALYDFKSRNVDELTIKEGEVISIYVKEDSDWWKGELNGAIGIFPASYVQEF